METFYIILTLIIGLWIIFIAAIAIGALAGFKAHEKFDDSYYNSGKIRKEDY